LLCLGVFMTNQFHKWAHMDTPPQWVARLQWSGLILSKEHHDTHHESPYDTYYCITVGVWNPLFDRINFFERTERLARRYVPGTDPYLRVEREGSLNAVTRHAPNATSRCGRSSRKTCAVCSERSRHSERRK